MPNLRKGKNEAQNIDMGFKGRRNIDVGFKDMDEGEILIWF